MEGLWNKSKTKISTLSSVDVSLVVREGACGRFSSLFLGGGRGSRGKPAVRSFSDIIPILATQKHRIKCHIKQLSMLMTFCVWWHVCQKKHFCITFYIFISSWNQQKRSKLKLGSSPQSFISPSVMATGGFLVEYKQYKTSVEFVFKF